MGLGIGPGLGFGLRDRARARVWARARAGARDRDRAKDRDRVRGRGRPRGRPRVTAVAVLVIDAYLRARRDGLARDEHHVLPRLVGGGAEHRPQLEARVGPRRVVGVQRAAAGQVEGRVL